VVPLPVLLARALLDISRRFEQRGRLGGEEPSLLLWSDLLRVIPDEGISTTELPRAARISRRAATIWLGLPWLDVQAVVPRHKLVTLTDAGRRTRDRWGALVVAAEAEWCTEVGHDRAKRLRGHLEALVSQIDVELPHYPMVYGPADARALGGGAVAARPGSPRVPAHRADWRPVVRRDGDT
jgi:hypothetical protein